MVRSKASSKAPNRGTGMAPNMASNNESSRGSNRAPNMKSIYLQINNQLWLQPTNWSDRIESQVFQRWGWRVYQQVWDQGRDQISNWVWRQVEIQIFEQARTQYEDK